MEKATANPSNDLSSGNPAPERLKAHFIGQESNPTRWDDLWRSADFLPWDRQAPNPALIDTLAERSNELLGGGGSTSRPDGSRRRAFVPGCGKGYDVLLFASFGFDAVGLDSGNAVRAAREWQRGHEGEYEVRDPEVGRGNVTFVEGDFFADDWEKGLPGGGLDEGFDVIYDYTFLCALPPKTRPNWALRMSQLLHKTRGNLICLEFPTYKPPSAGGPPWALYPAVYEQLLPQPGVAPEYNEDGYVVEQKKETKEGGMVRIAHWQPERTHKIGEGTDWVGVWRHATYDTKS